MSIKLTLGYWSFFSYFNIIKQLV